MKTIYFIISLLPFCTITLFGQDQYEPNNISAHAAPLNCGIFTEAYIQNLGDKDWFEVNVMNSGILSVEVMDIPSQLDLNLEIYEVINGQLKRIADDDNNNAWGGEALISAAYVSSGSYFILIEDENDNSFMSNESFNIMVSCEQNPYEVNQTIDLAKLIPADTCFQDNIWGENESYLNSNDGDDDQDWFMVDIPESGTFEVSLTNVPGILDLNVEIFQLLSNGQAKLISDDDNDNAWGGEEVTTTAFLDPGRYYIHIEDENHNYTTQESYTYCGRFVPNPFEVNQTIDLAKLIPKDTCFEDNIWGENENYMNSNDGDDDQDWFMVDISESGTFEVSLTDVPGGMDLNVEVLQISSNGQAQIISDDDNANAWGGEEVTTTAFLDPGRYYIHIEDENHNYTTQESYTYCGRFVPNPFEVNQTIELSKLISTDTCFKENIWGENENYLNSTFGDDDRDWFKIQVDSVCELSIDITDVPGSMDLNLELYTLENGIEMLVADDGIDNAWGGEAMNLTYTFPAPGKYYILIEDERNNFTSEEQFTVCIETTCTTTQLQEELNEEIQIYPNPFQDVLNLNLSKFSGELQTLNIINLQGEVVYQERMLSFSSQIHIKQDLPKGWYIIELTTDHGIFREKIIKR